MRLTAMEDKDEEKKTDDRFLDLGYQAMDAERAKALAAELQTNKTLLWLRLSGNKFGDAGGLSLASMLGHNNTLRELEVADCDLAIQSVIAFAIALRSNRSLLSIDISRPLALSLQEEWAVHFSEMLVVNSCLVELHLGKMGMTDTGMERLSEGLESNRCLKYLDLRCNRVTRDGARHLAKVLKKNRTLEVINLSFNRIENPGAVDLSQSLGWRRCSIRELSVCSNNIGTEGLLALAGAMTTNENLTHMYLWGNHPEEPVCRAFEQLIRKGRLRPEHTDVTAYEVDSHLYLCEVSNSLRKHYSPIRRPAQPDASAQPQPQPQPQPQAPPDAAACSTG